MFIGKTRRNSIHIENIDLYKYYIILPFVIKQYIYIFKKVNVKITFMFIYFFVIKGNNILSNILKHYLQIQPLYVI